MGWPLVGRGEELAAALESVTAKAGVVLAGVAGVGKTRLAREVAGQLEGRGWATCWATATAAARAIPFGALASLLPASVDGGASRANLLRVAAQELTQAAGGAEGGLVVAVDDAHLLDDHSAALLGLLAGSGQARVLATVRTGQACPDAVTGLWKEGWCLRVEVQALSHREVAGLLEAVLGGPVEGASLQRLWTACQVNPLVLSELVAGGVQAGVLAAPQGLWRWRGRLVTARLADLVQARLQGLSAAQQRVGEVVAVAAPVGAAILEQLTDSRAVQAAQRHGVVTEQADGRRQVAYLAHPIYGEVLRAGLVPAAARQICGQLAETVQACGARRQADLLRIATWRLQAGHTGHPDLFLQAARTAVGVLDHQLAHRLATAAAQAGAGFEAHYLRAETLIGLGQFRAADQLLAHLQTTAPTQTQQAMAAQTRALHVLTSRGQVDDALQALQTTAGQLSDSHPQCELAATRSVILSGAGFLDEAVGTGTTVLDQPGASGRALGAAGIAVASSLAYQGRPQQALRVLASVEERLDRNSPYLREWGFEGFRFVATLFSGQFCDAATRAEQAYHHSIDQAAPVWLTGSWASFTGAALRAQGRLTQAARWLGEGIALLEEADTGGHLALSLAELAHCHALQGDGRGAQQALSRAEGAWFPGQRYLEGFLRQAHVWATAANGETSAAAQLALDAADQQGQAGWRRSQACLLHQAARLGAADRAAPILADLARGCDAPVIAMAAAHAGALAQADASSLLEVSAEFEQRGALLYGAEAAAQAASIFRQQGRRGSALTATARARHLADQCEGAHTPALAGLDQPLPLTAREREIAGLAARGLTNHQIAGRLTISQRTVHNHLTHTYSKLGITGRDQLAGILLPHRRPGQNSPNTGPS